MEVTRYKNVIIFNIPLYYETNELVEMIDVIKEEHNLKITYLAKKEPEPEKTYDKVSFANIECPDVRLRN
jgi:hypothetical protein